MNVVYDAKAETLTIVLKVGTPRPSASGKTQVIATSGGNQATTAQYAGQPIVVGVNAYIRK